MSKGMMWSAVVVALVVGVFIGYFVEKQRATSNLESMKMAMQKQIDDAKMMANKKPDNAMMKSSDLIMMAKNPTLGSYVTAANDMTLYTFDKDSQNKSTCSGQCAITWPPYTVSGTVPTTLPAHMGTMTRDDGTTQYTWDGKPLYYYSGDKKVGDTNGDGIGGVWHVAK